jgi:hypothetical protein
MVWTLMQKSKMDIIEQNTCEKYNRTTNGMGT